MTGGLRRQGSTRGLSLVACGSVNRNMRGVGPMLLGVIAMNPLERSSMPMRELEHI